MKYGIGDTIWMRFNNRQVLKFTITTVGMNSYKIGAWGLWITEECVTEVYMPLKPGKGLKKHKLYEQR